MNTLILFWHARRLFFAATSARARLTILTLLTIASALLPPLSARAEDATGSVEGRVQNLATKSYLYNARVYITGTSLEAFSNASGEYRLDGVPVGQATLKVFYTGLPEIEASVAVMAGQMAQQDFNLGADKGSSEVVKLDPFVVASIKHMDASNLAINEQRFATKVENVVSADAFGDVTEGNVGEFIKYLPGVSVDYVAADVRVISIRGFSSNYTPVLVDGHRMASAASSSASRSFELEQISMNNVSRAEVTKTNTPDMEAESLGGGVNLISRSGFEFAHPVFNYRVYLSLNTEDLDLPRTRGPGQDSSYKYRPGFDFSYNAPLSKTLAITVSGLDSNQFNEQHRSSPQWTGYGIAGAAGSTLANPYLRKYTLQDGPKTTTRASTEITVDWKPTREDLVSLKTQYNWYDAFFGNRNVNWDVGTTLPAAWGPGFVQGATGAGSVQYGTSFRRKFGQTYDVDLAYQHRTKDWTIDGDVYDSKSTNHYRDTENGYFENATETLKNVTVRYDAIERIRPDLITATNAAGTVVDPYNLGNYTINTATSKPFNSSDEFKGLHLDVLRQLGLGVPASVKIGTALRQQNRSIYAPTHTWNFVGADGKAGTADDTAGGIVDANYLGMYPKFGFPGMVWPSAYRLYDLYKAHPEYFQYDVQKSYLSDVQTTQTFIEKIGAAYLMGETRLLKNRLRLVGGLRFERTEDSGVGGLTDATAGFQRDASGTLILVGGKPVKIADASAQTADILARNKVLGYHASSAYNGYYPSLNGSYNITDSLIARGAYSRTVGRPDLGNIIPSIQVSDPSVSGDQTITVSNPNLKPWKSDNFDFSLEYYVEHPVGVISIGVFEKQLHDFFGKSTRLATPDDLAFAGLPENGTVAYSFVTTSNIGSARITGVEFNYDQKLTFIPSAYGDFGLFVNGTQLHLQGPNSADFKNFIPRNYNWGLRYTFKRLSTQIKWNYRGPQKLNSVLYTDPVTKQSVDLGGAAYYRSRLYLDLNVDYNLFQHLSVFANARNVANVSQDQEQYDATTPGYARMFRREDYGVQFSLGIKGTF